MGAKYMENDVDTTPSSLRLPINMQIDAYRMNIVGHVWRAWRGLFSPVFFHFNLAGSC